MGKDEPAVRGLTGNSEHAAAIEADVTTLRQRLHTARMAMEMADDAAYRLRLAGAQLAVAAGVEYTADLNALIEEVQRDTRDLLQGHRMRSLQVAQTATFVLDELRRLRRA